MLRLNTLLFALSFFALSFFSQASEAPATQQTELESILGRGFVLTQKEHNTLREHINQLYTLNPNTNASQLFKMSLEREDEEQKKALQILAHSRFTRIEPKKVTCHKEKTIIRDVRTLRHNKGKEVLYILGPTTINGKNAKIKPTIKHKFLDKLCAKTIEVDARGGLEAVLKEAQLMNYTSFRSTPPPQVLMEVFQNNPESEETIERYYILSPWIKTDTYYLSENHIPGHCKQRTLRTLLHDSLVELNRLQEMKMVHRDLKPENITWNNGLSFIDFAGAYFPTLDPLPKLTFETLDFMAPEWALNKKISPQEHFKGDVFSLALSLLYIHQISRPLAPKEKGVDRLEKTRLYLAAYSKFYERVEEALELAEETKQVKKMKKASVAELTAPTLERSSAPIPTIKLIKSVEIPDEDNDGRKTLELEYKSFLLKVSSSLKGIDRTDLFPIFWKMLQPDPVKRITARDALEELTPILKRHKHSHRRKVISTWAELEHNRDVKHLRVGVLDFSPASVFRELNHISRMIISRNFEESARKILEESRKPKVSEMIED